jgi:SUN domain-containing protein 1/2
MQFVESTSEALFGDVSTSSDSQPSPTKRWAQQIIQEELRKKGVDAEPPSIEKLLHEPITLKYVEKSSSSTSSTSSYSTRDAVRDIDHRLEIEDADRTGQFDYASVIYGARILRRGPFATSYSYYETLPLLNRLLAYSKLRFYGHPPEVALYPTFPMHARGQCWSFSNEATSVRSRRLNDVVANDMVGEYATLTVSLVSAIRVTEIVVEHPPSDNSSSSTAIQEFRVLGFEDGGAFGEPWELGRYTFDVRGSSLQTFVIPTTLLGQNIPKLKSISIAIDSNWGAEYGCLYRVRVHGEI